MTAALSPSSTPDAASAVPVALLSEYLTPRQVAKLLQISEKTVLRWSARDPSMPVLRIGSVVRFHRERLKTWLERREPRSSRGRSTASSAA